MRIFSIVCEFNPFHNGHQYLISKLKKLGASHIVALMSGNFTQRGDVAVCSKKARTKMALNSGVDLVIELPIRFSLSPAEIFSRSAIYLIKAMGCIDCLGFGCENECLNDLINISKKIESSDLLLKKYLKTGITFSKARQKSIEGLYEDFDINTILKPNNILAIEYIKAVRLLNFHIDIKPVLRRGTNHSDKINFGSFASSSFLREKLKNKEDVAKFMPKAAYDILIDEIKNLKAPCFIDNGERALLAILRNMDINDLSKIQDISEGIENRLYKSIRLSNSVDELYNLLKTKRYTMARLRRIVLSSFLSLKKDQREILPQYIKVLGFNKNGLDILKKMKKTTLLPIVTKYSDLIKIQDKNMEKTFKLESKANDLYSLFMPQILKCGQEMTDGPIILK